MSINKESLGKSLNDKDVWFDPVESHTSTHIQDTPNLRGLAGRVISLSDLSGDYLIFHMDMGEVIGLSDLVVNRPGDEIVYAKRLNREEYTVFNKSRKSEPSSLVTVALERHEDDSYELVSTWIGPSDSPSFPGTPKEQPESQSFWSSHSLAWGRQKIQPGSETTECPW